MMGYWANPHTGANYVLTTLIRVTLPRMPSNNTTYESLLFYHLFQYMPKSPHLIHPLSCPPLLLFLYPSPPGFSCYYLNFGSTYKQQRWDIFYCNRFVWIYMIFCKYHHCQVIHPLFNQLWVWHQGNFCWWSLHIILSPRFCILI